MLPKTFAELAVFVVVLAIVFVAVCYGPPRFWDDFTGMTEALLKEKLGEPFRDDRQRGMGNANDFTLGWYQGFGIGFFSEVRERCGRIARAIFEMKMKRFAGPTTAGRRAGRRNVV